MLFRSLKDARAAGILVIALDTPLADAEAQDITFATDNFEAGLLIGKWAAATLGAEVANAKIAMLDINKDSISVDVARDTGFLVGFGIEVPDLTILNSETDPRVVGHVSSDANQEGGLRAMETLLAKEPNINVVYAINGPTAEGAYQALRNAGKEGQAIIVSADGACPDVASVKSGVIGATSQQYPLLMAARGIEAIAEYAKDGDKPDECPKESSFNPAGTEVPACCKDPDSCMPGVQMQPVSLITDSPVDGVGSIDTTKGLELCWG